MKDAQAPTTTEPPKEPSKDAPPPAQVPEKYDFRAPEGQSLDASLVERATPVFKELGLTQDQAQKLFDFYNSHAKVGAEAVTKMVDDMRSGWRDTTLKDAEMGPKMDAIKADIGRAKTIAFENDPKGLKAFNDAMDLTGAGDHPEIIRGWWRMAQRIVEGTHVSGKGPSDQGQHPPERPARPTAAQSLYPNLPTVTH